MPRRKKSDTTPNEQKTVDYRYSHEKRTNIPPARIAGEGSVPTVPKARYAYSPHLPPTLQFDPTGEQDKLNDLVDKATRAPLSAAEAERLRGALRVSEPSLEWAGKREQREKGFLEVDPVALHIHERVSARAIIRSALREDVQRDLFADPQQPYQQAVQFYKHDVDWANRLILGDSLQVMSSLARRENLAGKVQMIYMDPPYGIKFASNFQSEIGKRDVKDKEHDLTREAEMVKAYRDTWTFGVHSYLAYLRDRLIVARELLAASGSIFVQINDTNLHRVRALLDEVFGPEHFIALVPFRKKSMPLGATYLEGMDDFLLWYGRDKSCTKYHQLYKEQDVQGLYYWANVEEASGLRRRMTEEEMQNHTLLPQGSLVARQVSVKPPTYSPSAVFPITLEGRSYTPGSGCWIGNQVTMRRLARAERLVPSGSTISYFYKISDFPYAKVTANWPDMGSGNFTDDKIYAVQTASKVIERCILMTTDPGDLVLDPTCGSGTTAFAAERWGRRWMAVDTSRVAISLSRQRILTAKFEQYRLNDKSGAHSTDPSVGFAYASAPRVTLRAIARNEALDPIFDKHEPILADALNACTAALQSVEQTVRRALLAKLASREKAVGKRGVSDAERRRLDLPKSEFQHWTVPFDVEPEWPDVLQKAVTAYRQARQAKTAEVNRCIAANAEQVILVDRPEVVQGVVRVSGPFTVEGVRPEELNLGEDGLFDGTPNEFETEEHALAAVTQQKNLQAYLDRMVRLIRHDGLTFINNQRRRFSHVEPLFGAGTGAVLHAEGAWAGEPADAYDVAIGFGPQYGPVTALQVEELLRASKRHGELVVAGFSFDADATSLIQQYSNAKLRIHQAYIRPDVNPGMDGLLKDTPNSQLFTVFGTLEIEVRKEADGDWLVELKGVDIYDPVANTVRSTGADKVAAWFLDSDFDGRCFATTQAFFPDQDAWEKIAKALGSAADTEAFEAFKGTVSVPFSAGTHKRLAVKVIDPRGNEVMSVRALEA